MDTRQAVLAGAVVVGAVVWWMAGHPGYESSEQRRATLAALEDRDAAAVQGPVLYRCPGPNGVNTITDVKPAGRKCTQVRIRDDQNVVSLPASEPEPAKGKKR